MKIIWNKVRDKENWICDVCMICGDEQCHACQGRVRSAIYRIKNSETALCDTCFQDVSHKRHAEQTAIRENNRV